MTFNYITIREIVGMSESLKVNKTDTYFCIFCFGNKLFQNKSECEKHLREKHFIDSKSEERHGIDLWTERHLKYQESLSKTMSESIKSIPDRSKTLYRGCIVCDLIIKVSLINNSMNFLFFKLLLKQNKEKRSGVEFM